MGIPQKFLTETLYKSLLTPLSKGDLPKNIGKVSAKYRKSWGYQEEETGHYFLGTFYPVNVTPNPSDTLYTVEGGDLGRPDIISYKHYKTPDLYWVILWVNGIADPFEGLYPGMILRIPTVTRLFNLGVYS